MTTRVEAFPAQGGVNLSDPPWELKPGELILGFNYECAEKGYRRMDGYERYDGQSAPSNGSDAGEIEANRAAITVVPGEGPIRGVWIFAGDLYAFRDNVGQTECLMYKATPAGWSLVTTPTLSPGGFYRFMNANFYGTSTTLKMYGVDGVNKGFEFDGTTFTQITTGMSPDAPTHLAEYENYLVYAFPKGSLQFSPLGEPSNPWTLKTGTASIGTGDEITAIGDLTGNVLGIWCATKTDLLRGSSPSDFTVDTHSADVGAVENSLQLMGQAYFLSSRGLTSLAATQAFGDFTGATFSDKIGSVLAEAPSSAVHSQVFRNKNQYRLMWKPTGSTSRTQGVICAFKDEKLRGFTTFAYPFAMSCTCNGVMGSRERVFAGADNGFVYELDSGTSHDGVAIGAYLRFPFNPLKTPRYRKRFRKLVLEIDSPDSILGRFHEAFDYNDAESPSSVEQNYTTEPVGGFWNIDNWSEFSWGGPTTNVAEVKIAGTGKNMSVYLYTSLTYERPYTIQGGAVHYDIRRLER